TSWYRAYTTSVHAPLSLHDALPISECLGDGLEVTVAETDKHTCQKQHEAGTGLSEYEVADGKDNKRWIHHYIGTSLVHDPSGNRPCNQDDNCVYQEEVG